MHLKLTAQVVRQHFSVSVLEYFTITRGNQAFFVQKGHVCGDQKDLIDGYPTGSIRISFGYMSRKEDADAFLKMVKDYFVEQPLVQRIPQWWNAEKTRFLFSNARIEPIAATINISELCSDVYTEIIENFKVKSEKSGVLEKVLLYPIKSCGAFSVSTEWELTSTGLKYDRLWMIVNSSGVCVTQKNNRCLCLIKPQINLRNATLTLTYEGKMIPP